MGLFDSLFGGMEGRSKLNAQEAFAGVLFGASACDGHISDEEMQSLVTCLIRMKLYSRMNGKQFNQMMDKLHTVLKKKGVDVLIDGCTAALPAELEKTVFANACDIVLSDGVVEEDEKEFMDRLQRKLEIDDKTAKTIAQVMVVKNKG